MRIADNRDPGTQAPPPRRGKGRLSQPAAQLRDDVRQGRNTTANRSEPCRPLLTGDDGPLYPP